MGISVLSSDLLDRSFYNTRCWDLKHYLLLFAPFFPSKHNLADSSDHFSVVGQTVQHHVLNNNALQVEEVDAQLLDQTILLVDKTSSFHGPMDQRMYADNLQEVVLNNIVV